MDKQIHIYRIYFPTNGKCYVGQTVDLQRRMKAHFESGYLICKALWKYDEWEVSILHTCKSRDEANRIEIEEIRNFNSVAPNGYNLTRGGNGCRGYKHTEQGLERLRNYRHTTEIKEKISRNSKFRNRNNLKANRITIKSRAKAKLGIPQSMKCSELSKEVARELITKRNKESNPMQNTEIAKKQGLAQRGIQMGEKKGNYKNGMYTKTAKLKRLQNKLYKLQANQIN